MKKRWISILILLCSVSVFSGTANLRGRLADFRATEGGNWTVHLTDHGTIRSTYGESSRAAGTSNEAAERFLEHYQDLLGIDRRGDLKLIKVEESQIGKHYFYQQYFSGIPVVGGVVAIHV